MADAVDNGVTHIEVAGGQVDFGPEGIAVVFEFPGTHPGEKVQAFLNGPVPIGGDGMDVQSVSGNMQYSFGAINMQGALIANRYHYHRGIISQYGISGQIVYSFNPNLSATIFGTYYNTNPFISMAAFPFVPTTSYGGYMTVGNNSFYMNLGVERRYNTFEHKMETVPIISPAFKISNKVTVELPLGDLVKHVVEDVVMKNHGPVGSPHRH